MSEYFSNLLFRNYLSYKVIRQLPPHSRNCPIPSDTIPILYTFTANNTITEIGILTVAKPESKPKKKRPTDEERLKGIPGKKVCLEPSADERICGECGPRMEKIGTEFVRRELEIIPARARVIEYYSVNCGCKNCRRNAALPNIVKGKDGKAHMMYGMASASTVSWVVYQKYCNGMPLYRLERELGRLGAKISRATLADWVIKNGESFFTPMYDFFHRKPLCRDFAMADELCEASHNSSHIKS